MIALSKASGTSPQDAFLGTNPNASFTNFGTDSPVSGAPSSVGPAGGGQSHNNLQPYLCVNFIISLFGIFPTPT
jgi:microcystin-dependent protein